MSSLGLRVLALPPGHVGLEVADGPARGPKPVLDGEPDQAGEHQSQQHRNSQKQGLEMIEYIGVFTE